ncbi:hypothetical protein RhiirB3_443893 [Rhizophagus irregularis]|nr:hypothetical protein RhiirB3_443893 [Rhizophagus irregularis]
MLAFILKKYIGQMIQLQIYNAFHNIYLKVFLVPFVLGGNSSTHGHALNKYQVMIIKRIKYHKENKENINVYQKYNTCLSQLLTLSRGIFKNLLDDNLIIGRFKSSSKSVNDNINYENIRVYDLQTE